MEPEKTAETKDGSESSPSPKVSAEEKIPSTVESDTKEDKSEEKEVEKEQGDEKTAEDVPPTPQIKCTLHSTSEDVERFLSDLSGLKEKDTPLEISDFVHKFLDLAEARLGKLDSGENKAKWGHDPEDDASFLEAVSRISKLRKSLPGILIKPDDPNNKNELLINRIGGIQQRAMSFLEDEFRNLLEDCNGPEQTESGSAGEAKQDPDAQGSPDSTDELSTDFLRYSPRVLSTLKGIAKELMSGGFESECCQVYMLTRRHVFDEKLSEIGFDKIGMDDVHKMNWDVLEREIQTWNNSFKHCAAFFFCGERKLSEEVFADYPLLASKLFTDLNRGVLLQFLNFVEAVAMTKRSAEKLFKLLDMYETVRDHVPAVEGLFPEACATELQMETMTSRCRLGEAAISMFCDLENSIKSETNKTPVPGGAVHPLTRYTMNYLKYACEYKNSLGQIFKDHSKIERADSTSKPRAPVGEAQKKMENDNQPPFVAQLMRVMDLLDANLEGKSKLYKDVSLTNIFLMNNGRYILQKIKGSAETHELLGDHWCRKRSTDLRNYHKNYQRETWMKLIGCLSHDGLMHNGKIVKPALKEKFKSFNAMFDDIHRTQSAWVVSDEQLQSELQVSISAVVIPAYRSFMGRFSQYLDPGRQTEKYIKYQSEDLETCIEELFGGNAATSFMSRKKT